VRHERGRGTGLHLPGRSPGSSPCHRRRHSAGRAADPSSRDTVASAVDNALLHRSLRRRSRPRPVALCWLHRRGFTSLWCCRGSVPALYAPRPRRSFCTVSTTHVPAPGCAPSRACAASPGWFFVDASEEERPGCSDQPPIGHSEQLQHHRDVVVFLQELLPQQRPLLFLYPRAFAVEASRSSHARCVRGTAPLRPFSLCAPLRDHGGTMTPLYQPSHQRCASTVPTAHRRLCRSRSAGVPWLRCRARRRASARGSNETASPSRLRGDSSVHERDSTGTPIRRRLMPVYLLEFCARPHGVSRAPRQCRTGVVHRAFGGLTCAGMWVASPRRHGRGTPGTPFVLRCASSGSVSVPQVSRRRPG
jgi:hypothetical protein